MQLNCRYAVVVLWPPGESTCRMGTVVRETTNSWIVKTWNPDKETTGSKADWPMAHRIEQVEIGPREVPTAK